MLSLATRENKLLNEQIDTVFLEITDWLTSEWLFHYQKELSLLKMLIMFYFNSLWKGLHYNTIVLLTLNGNAECKCQYLNSKLICVTTFKLLFSAIFLIVIEWCMWRPKCWTVTPFSHLLNYITGSFLFRLCNVNIVT